VEATSFKTWLERLLSFLLDLTFKRDCSNLAFFAIYIIYISHMWSDSAQTRPKNKANYITLPFLLFIGYDPPFLVILTLLIADFSFTETITLK